MVRPGEDDQSLTTYAGLDANTQIVPRLMSTGQKVLDDMYKSLQEDYNKPRKGMHVSDLLCPRQSLFRRFKPLPVTNLELGFFLLGRSMHDAAQSLVKRYPDKYEIESEVWFDKDLEAHIDLYDKIDNVPVEMKTYRSNDLDQPKPHYLQQLHAYMAMRNANTGVVIVFLVLHFRSKINENTPLKEWTVSLTDEQLLEKKIWLLKEKTQYNIALKAKDPSLARYVYGTGKEWDFPCKNCKYVDECQTMRNKEAKKP